MKANIAFCPHFHQPHFQLYHTREEVYRNSYLPWLELLEAAAEEPGFHINLHFSGPLLLWLAQEKPAYLQRLKTLLEKDGCRLIGGLADEAFSQLSARPDDILFQVREYANLTTRFLGVNPQEWEGIHVVEREAGEWTLYHLAMAARMLGAAPVFYLDAETFYEPHFNYPGGPFDYCRRYFGIHDPHSRTTVSHLPLEMLFFALRDEIGGEEFFVLPVHSQFRYCLLKRLPLAAGDRSSIKPGQYVYYLKDAAEKSQEMARRLGKELEPVIVIFEDAEKLGQWSKDSQGDASWLLEFIRLVRKDPDLRFCGLRSYLKQQGYLDTYPTATSRSYPEWENWTARRGIRGVTFGDERLRKVMARHRDLERRIQDVDRWVLRDIEISGLPRLLLRDTVMDSPHRFRLVEEILAARHPQELARAYRVIQRVRNLAYQEDPRWASRHPSYGSCAYFDLQGLAYLELAERLADRMREQLTGDIQPWPEIEIRDWDLDGEDEVVVRTGHQTVVIHARRGQVVYQHAIRENRGLAELLDFLEKEMLYPVTYSEVLGLSHSLVFTETDSELREEFYPEGGRVERCRNSMGVSFAALKDGEWVPLEQESPGYRLVSAKTHEAEAIIMLEQSVNLPDGDGPLLLRVEKNFRVSDKSLCMSIEVQVVDGSLRERVCLVPELVTSVVPSDERELKPSSWLGIEGEGDEVVCEVLRPRTGEGSRCEVSRLPQPRRLAYVCENINGRGSTFRNSLFWALDTGSEIKQVVIEPAVKSYYRGHVFDSHSELGYDASGLLIRPYVEIIGGQASFQVEFSWQLGSGPERDEYRHVLQLL
ncbi:MAG: hypothetical protein GXY92_06660 [Syntrophomonadaceae bacterium]|nr:hypothetical protein [Syntrophomonadaceae bacterium]